MRIYAYLLVAAVAALHARAATIPALETDKKLIDIVPEDLDNVENISSEQELVGQSNTIKDVENKLRVKPEDIPVEVIVEDAQPALKTDSEKDASEEINRPVPDLRNPGPPQRQEHETQNPEYYASEQQPFLIFKQGINDAQNVLKQGFQGITDGIQNMLGGNEQINTIQHSIKSLRDGFTDQINKLNGTIQNYLNIDSSSITPSAVEQTKASFIQIEKGLNTLRNDFNSGVKTLADGAEIVTYLKAANDNNPSSGVTTAPASPSPSLPAANPLAQIVTNMQQYFNTSLHNLQETLTNQGWNPFNPAPSVTAGTVPAGAQADPEVTSATPVTSSTTNFIQNFQTQWSNYLNPGQQQNQGPQSENQAPQSPIQAIMPQPGQFFSGSGPIVQAFQGLINFIQPTSKPETQAPQGTHPAQPAPPAEPAPAENPAQTVSKPSETDNQPEKKPEAEAEPAKPAEVPQTAAVTPVGPIRQILQNNPISLGLAGAVQRLQNINNPEKPREVENEEEQKTEEVNKQDQDKADSDSKKKGHYGGGGGQNSGDNNDSNGRIGDNETVKEDTEMSPEQKPKEDEKEHKTEEVVDKTE